MNRKWYHEFDVRIPELFWSEKIRFEPNITLFLHCFLLLRNSDIAIYQTLDYDSFEKSSGANSSFC